MGRNTTNSTMTKPTSTGKTKQETQKRKSKNIAQGEKVGSVDLNESAVLARYDNHRKHLEWDTVYWNNPIVKLSIVKLSSRSLAFEEWIVNRHWLFFRFLVYLSLWYFRCVFRSSDQMLYNILSLINIHFRMNVYTGHMMNVIHCEYQGWEE